MKLVKHGFTREWKLSDWGRRGCGICQLRALRDGGVLLIMAFYFAGVHPPYQDLSRVCNNLHVVLCMSPVGDSFHTHCWMFLSLVNCCTIDWFTEWSRLVQWYSHDGSWDFSGCLFSYFSCNSHVTTAAMTVLKGFGFFWIMTGKSKSNHGSSDH